MTKETLAELKRLENRARLLELDLASVWNTLDRQTERHSPTVWGAGRAVHEARMMLKGIRDQQPARPLKKPKVPKLKRDHLGVADLHA